MATLVEVHHVGASWVVVEAGKAGIWIEQKGRITEAEKEAANDGKP
jgi:hypothetical protein